jgi:heterokaryon incompatibility protein Het-C
VSTEAQPVHRAPAPERSPPSPDAQGPGAARVDVAAILHLQGSSGNAAVARAMRAGAPAQPPPGVPPHPRRRPVAPVPRAAPTVRRLQRLEAQHHEHAERAALGGPGGLSDAETTATYFGNWQRDLSQVFVGPAVDAVGKELLFEIVNVLAMKKFGRSLDPSSFGVYSPTEHIDNPAGQWNEDLIRPKGGGAPPDREGGLSTDPRGLKGTDEDISSPDALKKMFEVNKEGLPAYIGRSEQYVEAQFGKAADLGRTEKGLEEFGSGLHTVEDLFAHSNFVEIGVGKIADRLPWSPAMQAERTKRKREGKDEVETLSGKTEGGRPLLVTGTFVMDDTIISIAEQISDMLRGFDPFEAVNEKRSQSFMHMLLQRYETLAGEGKAKQVVTSFLSHFGPTLEGKLAEAAQAAVAGEKPKEDASVLDKAVAGARQAAGQVVGAGVKAVGKTLESGVVQTLMGEAVNAIGTLPLSAAYDWMTGAKNAIDDWFRRLDQALMNVPGYPQVRKVVVDAQDALRQQLRELVQAAMKFIAEAIQRAIVESLAKSTNLAEQAKQQREALKKQIASIASDKVKDPAARKQLQGLEGNLKAQVALLSNPDWAARARLDPKEVQSAKQSLEHIQALESLPDYVKAGPSHSQIAKDHADSPFFGAAVALAITADRELRDRMVAVWTAEGKNTTDPKLAGNYEDEIPPEVRRRLESARTPEERRQAEREAAKHSPHWKELQNKKEAKELEDTGALAEDEKEAGVETAIAGVQEVAAGLGALAGDLPGTIRRLAADLDHAAPDTAAELRRLADDIPRGLKEAGDQVAAVSSAAAAQQLAARLHALGEQKQGMVSRAQDVLRTAASRAESAGPALQAAARGLRAAADRAEPTLTKIGLALGSLAEQLKKEDMRGKEQIAATKGLKPVATPGWRPEFRPKDISGLSPARQALVTSVRKFMNHPYENSWWEGPLETWAKKNMDRLEAYVRARNSGDMHHHG